MGPVTQQKVQVWIYKRIPNGEIYVLLLLTLPDRGNFWQPVTGSVDPGETLEATALREAQEESGLKFTSRLRPMGYEFEYEGKHGKAHETAFCVKANAPDSSPIQLDKREHAEFRWVRPDEARELLKFDSNKMALELLLALEDL